MICLENNNNNNNYDEDFDTGFCNAPVFYPKADPR